MKPTVSGFEYAGTELPENVSRYKILAEKNGILYHKYVSSPWIKKFNGLFGTNINSHKKFNSAEESFNEELMYNAVGFAALKVGGMAFSILQRAGGSIWKISNPLLRGFVYETARGANLVRNYPVIDKFINGIATSFKTLDFKAKTYQNSKNIFNKIKSYIDKLSNFQGADKGGINTVGIIEKKVLDIAVPKGATKEQVEMIQKAVSYGKSKNIEVKINVVK